jgi:hypothetical protein
MIRGLSRCVPKPVLSSCSRAELVIWGDTRAVGVWTLRLRFPRARLMYLQLIGGRHGPTRYPINHYRASVLPIAVSAAFSRTGFGRFLRSGKPRAM